MFFRRKRLPNWRLGEKTGAPRPRLTPIAVPRPGRPPRPSSWRVTRLSTDPETITLPLYLGDRTLAYADPGCKPRWLQGLQRGACASYHDGEIRGPRQPCLLSRRLTARPRVDAMDEVDFVDSGLRISCPCRPCSPFRPLFRPLRGSPSRRRRAPSHGGECLRRQAATGAQRWWGMRARAARFGTPLAASLAARWPGRPPFHSRGGPTASSPPGRRGRAPPAP